jgi:hypothetical protein
MPPVPMVVGPGSVAQIACGDSPTLLQNLVAGARVGMLTAYLGGHEQASTRPLPHDEPVWVQRLAALLRSFG